MTQKSKIGILKYVAKTGAKGCKFEDQPETWYNPANDEAKEMVKNDYIGKQVEIMLVDGEATKFSSMVLLDADKEDVVDIEEESIDEEEGMTDDEIVEHRMEEQLGETASGVPTGASHTEPKEEEKVSPEPLPKEEEVKTSTTRTTNSTGDFGSLMYSMADAMTRKEVDPEYFKKLQEIKVETATKGPHKLTYASWAEVWSKLKEQHADATYHVHEDEHTGMPYICADKEIGAFVKVSVKVEGISHTVHLPVMDHANKAVKGKDLDVFIINKNIMRAFAKAIAMHGIGLYVFKGEDFPEESSTKK